MGAVAMLSSTRAAASLCSLVGPALGSRHCCLGFAGLTR